MGPMTIERPTTAKRSLLHGARDVMEMPVTLLGGFFCPSMLQRKTMIVLWMVCWIETTEMILIMDNGRLA